MRKSYLYLFGLLFIVACSQNDVSPQNGIDAELVIIDKDGNRTHTIKQGEDFSLTLELTNNTDSVYYYHHQDYIRIFSDLITHKDFLMVYQVNSESSQLKPVGRPYDENYKPSFPDIMLPPKEISSGESIMLVGMQWMWNEDSISLPTGKYYSILKYTTTLESIPGKVYIDTDITFEVQ